MSLRAMAHHKPSQAFLYNDTYDAAVKALVKSSQTCVPLSRQPVVKEVLGDISNLVQAEKKMMRMAHRSMVMLMTMITCLARMMHATQKMSSRSH